MHYLYIYIYYTIIYTLKIFHIFYKIIVLLFYNISMYIILFYNISIYIKKFII